MKRFIIAILFNTLMLASCSRTERWSKEQIKDFKQKLEKVNSLEYLGAMADSELETLAHNIAGAIERHNPNYQTFISLPSSGDTITTYVISFMSYHLDMAARNLESLYPYHTLTRQGILPTGMSRESRDAFYVCLESKIKARYKDMTLFLGALSYPQGGAQEHVWEYISECATDFR